MSRKTRLSPTMRLYFALCRVSVNMRSPAARRNAAAAADEIGRTYDERYNTRYAKEVRHARSFLRHLPGMPDDMLDLAARDARSYADIVYGVFCASRGRKNRESEDAAA